MDGLLIDLTGMETRNQSFVLFVVSGGNTRKSSFSSLSSSSSSFLWNNVNLLLEKLNTLCVYDTQKTGIFMGWLCLIKILGCWAPEFEYQNQRDGLWGWGVTYSSQGAGKGQWQSVAIMEPESPNVSPSRVFPSWKKLWELFFKTWSLWSHKCLSLKSLAVFLLSSGFFVNSHGMPAIWGGRRFPVLFINRPLRSTEPTVPLRWRDTNKCPSQIFTETVFASPDTHFSVTGSNLKMLAYLVHVPGFLS